MHAGSLRERLARVALDRPVLRRGAVEDALWQHLSAVGAETDSVTWVDDIEEGFERVRARLLTGHRAWAPSSSGSWERSSLWAPDAEIAYPDRVFHRRRDPIGAAIVRAARASMGRRWRVRRTSRTRPRWRESYVAVADPVAVYRLALSAAEEEAIVRAGPPRRDDFREVASGRPEWLVARKEEERWKHAVRTYDWARSRSTALAPLVDAWAGGLLCVWVIEWRNWRQRACVAVPRPALHLDRGHLHRADGPAVEWPRGPSYWFWQGLPVSRRVAAQQSERARLQVLVRTRSVEVRRMLLQRMGYERFLDAAGATRAAQDGFGTLWRCDLAVDGEPLTVVEVVNATLEPDGTRRRYFVRVPPRVETAQAAVAWTFGFSGAGEYSPAQET